LDVGMTVSEQPPPAGNPRPASIYDPLSTRDLDLLLALISAGSRMVSAVHPLLCPLWHDMHEVMGDLDAAWWRAYDRENPGRRRPSPRPLVRTCAR
jgi:hypothetical protein